MTISEMLDPCVAWGNGVEEEFFNNLRKMADKGEAVVIKRTVGVPKAKKVIFNPPATIVFWNDNTKTVVQCHGFDDWDAEKGVAMAFMKKILGNKGNYNNVLKTMLDMAE